MVEALLFNIAVNIAGGVGAQVIGSLGTPVRKELGLLWGLNGELQKLQKTVLAIQAVLLDAEEKQVGDNAVRLWLARLEDVVYEADDLLDDFNTEGLLREMMTRDKKAKKVRLFFSKSNQPYYGLKMADKIKAIREELDAVATDRQFSLEIRTEGKKIGVSSSEQRYSHSFVPAEEVFGREDDKEKLIGFLLTESNLRDNVAILSIVGIGGLGKTTLAQLLFNDNRIDQNDFKVKMWVCVSLDFDVKKIVEKMIESATKKKTEAAEMDTLISKLREVIGEKKYFLVLDDVWEEDGRKWDELEKVLRCGARGSRVLVTTRSERVANTTRPVVSYSLNGLDEEGSWSLFKQMAFENGEEEESARIIEIGREIVKKCQGVPLLIRTIGRLLYSRRSETEWSSFQKKELAEINEEKIVETLKLSYNCLPSHLKHCFAYCSIFPKDFVIKKSMLINLWIAQGFIKPTDQNQCLEDIAHDYFMELLWRSFFQEAQTDKFGDIGYCKMHDFMHDLAVKVSGSSFTTFDSENKLFDESKTRHVAIGDIDFLSAVPTLFSKASTMRTLFFHSKRGSSYLTKSTLKAIFSSLMRLRTLDLHNKELDVVPSSVSKLKHLRYLDFSKNPRIKKLPDSITRLQNLHTLRLNGCKGLEELPRDIKKLINLRHLEIDECWSLTCMPRGLGQLTNLMTLSMFVVNSEGGVAGNYSGGLYELKGLNSLRGKLVIRGLVNGKDVATEYKAANLKDKQHLHTLELKWINIGEYVVDPETQLEGLRPHPNLKGLYLYKYGGVRLPDSSVWLPSNLVNLRISQCKNLKYLPPLSQLPSLNRLTLEHLYDLEYIEDSNMVSASFSTPIAYLPSLKAMGILSCPKLKGWCRRMDSLGKMRVTWMEDYPNLLPSFPLFSKLSIVDCPMLTSMPTFPHLEELDLKSASWKLLQQTMMRNVAALESRSAAIASPALVASSPTLSKLKSLTLDNIVDLRSLPEEGLQNLTSLKDFSISDCKILETLSRVIQHLTALQTLKLSGCDELIDLGKDDDSMQGQGLKSLRTLRFFSLPKLVSLPEKVLRNFISLEDLLIYSCKRLETLSRGIQHLTALQSLSLMHCDELDLGKDDDWMQGLKSLRTLKFCRLPKLVSLPEKGLRNLTSLQDLSIFSCKRLETLSRGIQHLTALQTLELCCCDELDLGKDDVWMQGLKSLRTLIIGGLPKLVSLPEKGLRNLTSLQDLSIYDCKRLETLSRGIQHLTALQTLKLSSCDELDLVMDDDCMQWKEFRSLETLSICSLPKLVSLPSGLQHLTTLRAFEIRSWVSLTAIPDWIHKWTSLEEFTIWRCTSLTSLPEGMRQLTSLRKLNIWDCPILLQRCERDKGKDWPKIARIPDLSIF